MAKLDSIVFSVFTQRYIATFHYNCWQLFVKACHILCQRTITTKEISDTDMLLNEFCLMFENMYGKERCNINLHLHGHLHECLKDYGPVYLFSFEQLNGVLGTNCHDLSLQIMRRLLRTSCRHFVMSTKIISLLSLYNK